VAFFEGAIADDSQSVVIDGLNDSEIVGVVTYFVEEPSAF
jgi:hypothetical protein